MMLRVRIINEEENIYDNEKWLFERNESKCSNHSYIHMHNEKKMMIKEMQMVSRKLAKQQNEQEEEETNKQINDLSENHH